MYSTIFLLFKSFCSIFICLSQSCTVYSNHQSLFSLACSVLRGVREDKSGERGVCHTHVIPYQLPSAIVLQRGMCVYSFTHLHGSVVEPPPGVWRDGSLIPSHSYRKNDICFLTYYFGTELGVLSISASLRHNQEPYDC